MDAAGEEDAAGDEDAAKDFRRFTNRPTDQQIKRSKSAESRFKKTLHVIFSICQSIRKTTSTIWVWGKGKKVEYQ